MWTYRKPPNTKLLLTFNAVCPSKWNSGLILCLLNRAKCICLSDYLFNREVKVLKFIFLNNGYPSWFFEKNYNRFINSDKKATHSTVMSFENCIFIPYIGKESRRFANRLSGLIENNYDQKISPIFKTFKVNNYFPLKSKTPKALCSNAVYKFTCSCDTNKIYIGMSSRHLITRVREHLNFGGSQESAIKDHIISCNTCSNIKFDLNNFSVLRKCNPSFRQKYMKLFL